MLVLSGTSSTITMHPYCFRTTPSGARQAAIWNQSMPIGWTAITPWGQAIGNNGNVEIKSLEIWCDVNGVHKTIINDITRLEAGLYKTVPWFGNDTNTPITPTKTVQGTYKLPVFNGKITHWWFKTPRPSVQNAKNCYVKSEMKMTSGIFASVGGDYWRNSTTGWQGQDIANKAIGMSDWYDNIGDWQTLIMGKGYTLPSRIY